MDRRDLYKINLTKHDVGQRREISRKNRNDNRSNAFFSSRQIESSLCTSDNPVDTSSQKSVTLSKKEEIKNKRILYLEKYKKWKQEKLEKENRLKEEMKNKPKPFINVVRTNYLSLMPPPPPTFTTSKVIDKKIEPLKEIKFKKPEATRLLSVPKNKAIRTVNPVKSASKKNSNLKIPNEKKDELSVNDISGTNSNIDFVKMGKIVSSTARKTSKGEDQFIDGDDILSPIETELITEPTEESPEVQKIRDSVKYYQDLLNFEVKRLKESCTKWETYKHDNFDKIQETENNMISATVDLANILINNKLQEFKSLIEKYESCIPHFKDGTIARGSEELLSNKDLEGFWSVVILQIKNVNRQFENLDKWQVNDWKDPDNEDKVTLPKKKKTLARNLKREQKKKKQPNKQLISLLKNQKAQQFESEDVIFIPKKKSTEHPITPSRKSARMSSKSEVKRSSCTPHQSTGRKAKLEKLSEGSSSTTNKSQSRIVRSKSKAKEGETEDPPKTNAEKTQKNVPPKGSAKKNPSQKPSAKKTNDNLETDSTITPEKPIPIEVNYVSPYVTVSRGKVSAKKEKERRSGVYTLELSSPEDPIEVRESKEAVKYFRNILNNEIQRLNSLCNKWMSYKEENMQKIEEGGVDMINVTVGQTNLLINKKFQQFKNLIDKCESCIPHLKDGTIARGSEELVLCQDLEGFWSMITLQIENVDKRFENLDRWQVNDWKDPDEAAHQKKKKVTAKKPKSKQKKLIHPTQSLMHAIKKAQAEHKQKRNQNSAKDKEVLNISNLSTKNVLPPTPLRRSTRLLLKLGNSATPVLSSTRRSRLQKISPQGITVAHRNINSNDFGKPIVAVNTPIVNKSILKPQNSTRNKKRVAFSKKLQIRDDITHEISGFDFLNISEDTITSE